jgi:4-amino-4-deoxy-L-arabinose transferase-like glycosyltransferase
MSRSGSSKTSTSFASAWPSPVWSTHGGLIWLFAALLLFLAATRQGIGVGPDSTRYMGLGPEPYDAPGYAWLLQGLAGSGLGFDRAGLLIGFVLTGANVLLAWSLLRRLDVSAGTAFVATGMLVLSPQFNGVHALAMSEPLFILFMLLCLHALVRFWEGQSRFWLALSSACLGACALVRFVAPPLGAAVAIVLLVDSSRSLRRRVVDVVLFAGISVAIFGIWVLVSQLTRGRSTGRPLQLLGNFSDHALWTSIDAVTALVLPTQLPLALRLAVLLALVAIVVALALAGRDGSSANRNPHRRARRLLSIGLAAFLVLYMAFFWLATQLEANLNLNGRYLLPAYVGACLLIATLVEDARPRPEWGPRLVRLCALVFGALLLIHFVRTAESTRTAFRDGVGYASIAWAQSPTMAAVAALPAHAAIYTNGPDVIGYRLNRPAQFVPRKFKLRLGIDDPADPYVAQVERLQRDLDRGNTYVVFFDKIGWRFYLDSEREVVDKFKLVRLSDLADGRVFAIPNRVSETVTRGTGNDTGRGTP